MTMGHAGVEKRDKLGVARGKCCNVTAVVMRVWAKVQSVGGGWTRLEPVELAGQARCPR